MGLSSNNGLRKLFGNLIVEHQRQPRVKSKSRKAPKKNRVRSFISVHREHSSLFWYLLTCEMNRITKKIGGDQGYGGKGAYFFSFMQQMSIKVCRGISKTPLGSFINQVD